MVLRTCTVAVKDLQDVEHSLEVTAETLYEAVATAVAALQKDNWVGEIGQGFTTITVLVHQPPIRHEVKMKDFISWHGRQGRSPAEVTLKQKLERRLSRTSRDTVNENLTQGALCAWFGCCLVCAVDAFAVIDLCTVAVGAKGSFP